jgi:hypothetical protein
MESLQNNRCDYRGKFSGVKTNMNRFLIQFMKENYDYQVNDKDKVSQNYMTVWGWKLQDSDNDLLFYFVQRKCYNDITRLNVVRTAGLQLSTARGRDIFEKYFQNETTQIRKVNKKDDIPTFFEDEDE